MTDQVVQVIEQRIVVQVVVGQAVVETGGGGGGATNLSYNPATRVLASSTGDDATLPLADGANAGLMASADKTKLDSVAPGATANASDASLRDRSTHTGTQPASTITGLAAVATSGSASDLSAGTLPAARFDDTAHGSRAGGALHAAATGSTAGFMTAADKTKLDAISGTNTGDQTITLTGDVTGSGTGSFATTIANNAVTLTKMQDFTTDVLLGRDTAGSGDPELIGVGGGIEFNGAGVLRTSAFTGDVTKVAGGTALTIPNNTVDNARLADMAANTIKANATAGTADPADLAVGANTVVGRVAGNIVAAQLVDAQVASATLTNAKLASVATATIKGRVTAGSGAPEDLTGTQATALLDTFTSGAKGLAPASGGGTSNFLRADGTWAAPAGGSSSTPYDVFEYFTDFYTTVSDQVCQSFVSNGANSIVAWPFAGNPEGSGFVRQSLNATTGVRAAWGSANIAVANYLRQGVSLYRTFGSLMDLGASRVYECNLGFVNDHTADPTYGCFFRYENGVNSGKWEAVTVAGGSPTVVDTGVTAVIDTMTLFEVEVNAAGTSVDFRIDGASVATITTTIPGAGINLGFTNSIRHVSGTAAVNAALWDYQYVSQEFTGR